MPASNNLSASSEDRSDRARSVLQQADYLQFSFCLSICLILAVLVFG